jgi:hypothetical protein
MKTHSSGVPMFFGIYLVCLMLIGCLFLIKNDATRIRSAEMVVPELKDFTPVRKRIRLVQMNPIKKFAPAKLLRPSCTPNVFVAILPPAEKDGLASVAPKQIGAWRMLLDFGQTISAFSSCFLQKRQQPIEQKLNVVFEIDRPIVLSVRKQIPLKKAGQEIYRRSLRIFRLCIRSNRRP